MIASKYRFHGHNSLRYVYSHGKTARSRNFALRWTPNAHRHYSRFSVVVSKKILKSAVKRNRVRRRIYEYIRANIPQLDAVHDIVIIVTTPEPYSASYADLTAQLDKLFIEAELYKNL